jgi:hypothetical protein
MPETLITPFARTFALPSGQRVRVRLARPSDRDAVGELLAAQGVDAGDMDLGRLLNFDPRERLVLAALTPEGGADMLAGIGAIDLRPDADPDLLVAQLEALGQLLGEMLSARADAHARRAA